MARVDAALTAQFSPLGAVPGLKLRWGGPINEDGIGFQLYPDLGGAGLRVPGGAAGSTGNLKVVATNGTVTKGAGKVVTNIRDVVIFSGSDIGDTQLPVEKLVNYSAVDSAIDQDGNPVSVILKVDGDTKQIKASKPCYGAFIVQYNTSYRQYQWKHSGTNYAGIRYLGVIFATYRGATATLQVDVDVTPEKSNVTEVYRVVSEYVADESGQWEKPDSFPDSNSYPGENEGPDQDSFQLLERVHEAGFINQFGEFYYRTFTVRTLQPYSSNNTYKPVLTYKATTNPPDKFVEAYNQLDIGQIKADVLTRWPGVEGL